MNRFAPRMRWGRFACTALACAMFGAGVVRAADDDTLPSGATIDAIWHIERIAFTYQSSTVRYECGALQRRIAEILHAVGAHARVGVELTCVSGDMVRHAGAHITLAVPVEATAENVAAATDYDTRDELVARLRQEQLPSASDIERFPASWRTVALTRSPPLALGPTDCDLLRSMRDQVFPRLRVRVVSSGLNCGGGSDTRIQPRIHVNALMPSRT
ncbi:MAG TPA: hypothetical protein VFV69_09150 [Steroidobacteraceae bacterium]|jgi:hypothetical protein|nr:hypothetical protein [Steroidobacteraceae bacterium]